MRRLSLIFLAALGLLALLAAAAGCASGRAAARAPGPPPRVELRIPGVDTAELDIERKKEESLRVEQALPQPELRFSPAEEAQGRWLRLFEIDVNPSASAGIPEEGEATREMPDGP